MANQRLNLAVVCRGKLIPVYICHTVIVASKLTATYWERRPRGGLRFSTARKHADMEITRGFTWEEETMRNQYAAGGIECLQMSHEHERMRSSCVQCKMSHMWGSLQCFWVFIFILEKGNQNSTFSFVADRHGNGMVHAKSISIRGNVAGWTSAFDIEQKKLMTECIIRALAFTKTDPDSRSSRHTYKPLWLSRFFHGMSSGRNKTRTKNTLYCLGLLNNAVLHTVLRSQTPSRAGWGRTEECCFCVCC